MKNMRVYIIALVVVGAGLLFLLKSNDEEIIWSTTTTTIAKIPKLEKCENMSFVERDLCYLGIAVNRNNETLCLTIKDDYKRNICYNRTKERFELDSAIIEGQVLNKFTGKGYQNLLVEVYNTDNDVEVGSGRTDSMGWYEIVVPSGNRYSIVVKVGTTYPVQIIRATKNQRYLVYFVLK